MRPHQLSRRDLVRLGAASLGGALVWPAAAGARRHLITVAAYGGWDATFTVDPKLGVPGIDGPDVDEDPSDPDDREAIRTFGAIPVAVNPVKRPAVTAFFEAWADRTVVVNGVSVAALGHQQSVRRVLTGAADGSLPDLGAIAGAANGAGIPLAYADLANQSWLGGDVADGAPSWAAVSGRIGAQDQLRLLVDPSMDPVAPAGTPWSYPTWRPSDADRTLRRAFLSGEIDRWAAARPGEDRVDRMAADRREALDRARLLRARAGALSRRIDNGTGATLAEDAAVVVDGIAQGVWHSALLDSRIGWDSHTDNVDQHAHWDELATGLSALLEALTAADLLEDTLVVVISEMTRTPLLNPALGKDHWPWASAMLIGGGVARGGTVTGATDDGQIGQPIDLETGAPDPAGTLPTYASLAAGILERLDVDPAEHLPGVPVLRAF